MAYLLCAFRTYIPRWSVSMLNVFNFNNLTAYVSAMTCFTSAIRYVGLLHQLFILTLWSCFTHNLYLLALFIFGRNCISQCGHTSNLSGVSCTAVKKATMKIMSSTKATLSLVSSEAKRCGK